MRELIADAGVVLAEVQLLAPVPDPRKFMAIGMNYAKHVAEAQAAAW
jgi:2-keto-4-pentenoate hydratase/2-oxohepta-3-ene-1,7-dioic acid hydratase in catechol pathway